MYSYRCVSFANLLSIGVLDGLGKVHAGSRAFYAIVTAIVFWLLYLFL
jgi:hypothetical protein